MRYMGSKRRIAKDLLKIMLPLRKKGQVWVEPFVGGANLIQHIDGERIGADNNKYLIALFKGLQEGRIPPKPSQEIYTKGRLQYRGKENFGLSDFDLGYIGFLMSFRGRFFQGYCGVSNRRDYLGEHKRNIEKQINKLMNVKIINRDNKELDYQE